MAFGSITKAVGGFFEGLGGPKMGDASRFHDPEELKKWKEKSEKTYGKFGARRTKYSGRADKEYDLYGKGRAEARRLYGKQESATGRAQAAVGQAALRERRAGELADDRQHYAGLRDRAEDRRRQRQDYRLELEGLQQQQPGGFDAMQAMVMDAAKMGNQAVMAQTEAVASGLAKTNPVAAAKLMMDAQNSSATNLAKAKQQGWFAGQENRMKEMQFNANKIMQQSGMLGAGEQADRYLSEARGQQIQEQMGLSQAALGRSTAELNVAGMYGQQGQQEAALASQSAQMSMGYDQMSDQMLEQQASIEEQRMGREQELMLSDRMAQQQVDKYNAGRMGRGIQTGLAIAGTAANIYSGISAGMAANAQADLYSKQAAELGGQQLVDQGSKSLISNVSHKRNPNMNRRFASSSARKFNPDNITGGAGPSIYDRPSSRTIQYGGSFGQPQMQSGANMFAAPSSMEPGGMSAPLGSGKMAVKGWRWRKGNQTRKGYGHKWKSDQFNPSLQSQYR